MLQAPDLRRAILVDVQVDFQSACCGHLEQAVELEVDCWGHITARRGDAAHDAAVTFYDIGDVAVRAARECGIGQDGQALVITAGMPFGTSGTTKLLRIAQI